MAGELLALLWIPFLMCLVLTGIHAYLGVHVLSREVVFVDIALAQIAALGATAAFLLGWEAHTWESYAFGLSATFLGALVLSLTRSRRRHVSQEAVIGVVYAVSSAAAVLLSDRAAHGAEQVRAMLVGNLLAVRGPEVVEVAALYAAIGVFHFLCRRPLDPASLRGDPRLHDARRRLCEPAVLDADRQPREPCRELARQDDGAHGKRAGTPDDSGRRLVPRDPLRRADVQGDRRRDQCD